MTQDDALWALIHAQQHILQTADTEVGGNSFAIDGSSFDAWRVLREATYTLAGHGETTSCEGPA